MSSLWLLIAIIRFSNVAAASDSCAMNDDMGELMEQIQHLSMELNEKQNEIDRLEEKYDERVQHDLKQQDIINDQQNEIKHLKETINRWEERMNEKMEKERIYKDKLAQKTKESNTLKQRLKKQQKQVEALQK